MNENIRSHYFENDDKMHEECGVFGMYDFDNNDVATSIYYGLFALQHRGQESCGIAVSDTEGPKGKVSSMKGMGLVNEVYTPESFEKLKGNIGVGHVRYSTAGASTIENAQPLVLNYVKGTLGLAHNGNLINAPELRKELALTGAIFRDDDRLRGYCLSYRKRTCEQCKCRGSSYESTQKSEGILFTCSNESKKADRSQRSVWIPPALYRKT